MKSKFITIKPISARARSIFKNKMESNGQCKVEMEGESMIFLTSVKCKKNLVIFRNTDANWAIVPDQQVAQ